MRRLIAADAACALLAAGLTTWLFGVPGSAQQWAGPALAGPLLWVLALSLAGSYGAARDDDGIEEFRRTAAATAILVATIATLSWSLWLDVPHGLVLAGLPLACLLTLAQRHSRRVWLRRRRARGHHLQTTLLVGHRGGVAALRDQLSREPGHGYRVIGCCLPSTEERSLDGLPVLGDLSDVARVVDVYELDTVAVLPMPGLDGGALRRLGRDLECTGAELLLAPALTDVAGPQARVCSVFGLPLVRAEWPELRGGRRLVKSAVDRGTALVLLLLMLPVFLAIAVAVELTSPGPVFSREERAGRSRRVFGLLRFRCTVADAPPAASERPRLTPVGRFLRRHALDEVPQLLNLLGGQMSLVGPRPLRPRDVERYGPDMDLGPSIKPGLTGLWPASGRWDPSSDGSVRMELRYVENWSLALDVAIIWRALRTAIRGLR